MSKQSGVLQNLRVVPQPAAAVGAGGGGAPAGDVGAVQEQANASTLLSKMDKHIADLMERTAVADETQTSGAQATNYVDWQRPLVAVNVGGKRPPHWPPGGWTLRDLVFSTPVETIEQLLGDYGKPVDGNEAAKRWQLAVVLGVARE